MMTSPPLPPSPPLGPPRGTYFSRRKAMHPFPPSPALTRMVAWSMNMISSLSRAAGQLRLTNDERDLRREPRSPRYHRRRLAALGVNCARLIDEHSRVIYCQEAARGRISRPA